MKIINRRLLRLFINKPKKILLAWNVIKVWKYTLCTYSALSHTHDALERIKELDGDIVEMGCWNGGCSAFMAKYSGRKVWLFDSFQGLPEFSIEDKLNADKKGIPIKDKPELKPSGVFDGDINEAYKVLDKMNVRNQAEIVSGWFEEALPRVKDRIEKIALLRLDCDMYNPTRYCLDELYDKVVVGGCIVLDDWSWQGSRKAIYEFFNKRNIAPYIQTCPYSGRAVFFK